MQSQFISPAIANATKRSLEKDPVAKKINEITEQIESKQKDIAELRGELLVVKETRPEIKIKWRESIRWCLEIDANDPRFFLKPAVGVYNCVAFKNKVDITADMKNKISTTLARMYGEGKFGRIEHAGVSYYGLVKFFNKDLKTLKNEYMKDWEKLIA